MDLFDFCDDSRVIQELPPEVTGSIVMNGWEFSSRPIDPYRRHFTAKIHGLRWYKTESNTELDLITDQKHNAGRLLQFYRTHQTYSPFILQHEYLGRIIVKFGAPVTIPPALPSSGGLVEAFDVTFIHYNPSY